MFQYMEQIANGKRVCFSANFSGCRGSVGKSRLKKLSLYHWVPFLNNVNFYTKVKIARESKKLSFAFCCAGFSENDFSIFILRLPLIFFRHHAIYKGVIQKTV